MENEPCAALRNQPGTNSVAGNASQALSQRGRGKRRRAQHGGEHHQGVKANKKIPKILFFSPISVTESGKGKV